MHIILKHIIVLGLFGSLAACSSNPDTPPPGGSGGSSGFAPGIETMGLACIGACGSSDDRKCATGSPTCKSNLCLIDPSEPFGELAYCSLDCTASPCPEGWRCEPIATFSENKNVTRGCVADPPVCGDGVVQFTEFCDGDKPEMGACIDCKSWKSICGDGFVQEGELCDGDTATGYCSMCTEIIKPTIEFAFATFNTNGIAQVDVMNMSTSFYGVSYTNPPFTTELPTAGDADGCGAMKVIESTAEYVRLEWTTCNPDAIETLAFGIPRTAVDYANTMGVPEPLFVTVHLRNRAMPQEVTWHMSDAVNGGSFKLRTYSFASDGSFYGNLQFQAQIPDPNFPNMQVSTDADITFKILPPVLLP